MEEEQEDKKEIVSDAASQVVETVEKVSEDATGFWTQIKDFLSINIIELDGWTFTYYNILKILLILLAVKLIFVFVRRILNRKVNGKTWINEGRQHAVEQIAKYIIYTLAILYGFRSVGVDLTPILIGSSALFIGLGFGLQEAFKDFISGLILLFEGDVVIGDVIEFENGMVAVVKRIKLRTSKVRTRDGIVVFVPNSKLINDRVINWSNSNLLTRFHVSVGVAYGSDTALVEKILLEVAEEEEAISNRATPFARFADFGDSSLDFELHFWSEEVWRIEYVKSKIRFAIDKKFRENKVSIPFPQRDLHLKTMDFPLGNNKQKEG